MNDLTVDELSWASRPALSAGLSFFIEYTGPLSRLVWRFKGVTRGKWEVGLRTARGTEFLFAASESIDDCMAYAKKLAEMNAVDLMEHLKQFDDMDEESGYRVSDALMTQWHEICHRWARVVPGDYVALECDQEVETVDGEGMLRAGTAFKAWDILFDSEQSVLSHSTTGDVVATSCWDLTVLSPRNDQSGRKVGGQFAFQKDRGYVEVREGSYEPV